MGRLAYISAGLAMIVLFYGFDQARAQSFMSLDYRSYNYQPGGQDYYQAYYRVGTDQTSGDFRSRSFFEFNANSRQDPALNRAELQLAGWKLLGGRWDASLGDVSMASLSPSQSAVALRGSKLVTNWGQRITAETYAGRTPDRYRRGNFPTFNKNDLIVSQGMKAVVSKPLMVKSRISFRRDKEPESYYSYLQARELYDWTSRVEWDLRANLKSQNQLSLSYNRLFNGARRSDLSGGSSWEYHSSWLRGSADYQYKGPDYIGPSNDGNGCREQQLAFSSSGVLLKKITLSSNYNQKWTGKPADTLLPWNNYQRWGAGLQTSIPRWPVFSYKLERYRWAHLKGDALFYGTLQWTNRLELQHNWRLFLWRLGYQLQDSKNLSDGTQKLWHSWWLNGGQRLGTFSLNLDERISRYNDPHQLQWSQSFGFDQRWGRLLTTSSNITWTQGNSAAYRWKTESWGWNFKAGTDRRSGWNLSADVNQNYYFYSVAGPAVRNTSWGFKLDRRFDGWGQLVSLGQINGRVYEDANGNMVYDNGDKGMPGIPIMIDGKRSARTDQEGRYRVLGIAAGGHAVKLDITQLNASMDPGIGGQRRFTTVGVWGPQVDFPLAPLNEVYGEVFFDENRNGEKDDNESGLPGVFILFGENRRFTSSDEEGSFIFHNVQPGRYRIFIDPRFLPDTLTVTSPQQLYVEVENQNDIRGIVFGIGKKVRPVRKVVFGASQVAEQEPAKEGKPQPRNTRPVAPSIKPSPQEVKKLYDQGIKQYASGDYQKAWETWQQLLKIDPGNKNAQKNMDRTRAKLEAQQKAKGQ